MKRRILFLISILLITGGGVAMALELNSPAFKNNEFIPKIYTCEGADNSPKLSWSGAPDGTKSFVLINDDPDAPMGTWVHWLVYDIPSSVTSLDENVPKSTFLENGAKQGNTSFGSVGYGGPCPPPGKAHRYFFKLYALDTLLNLKPGVNKSQLIKAMEGHVLAEAQLVGLYKR
ncbi:MAG: YbhB/YbcL family Raf kinase inhibitor-like protein [Candidatus Omnitrophota bacterium]